MLGGSPGGRMLGGLRRDRSLADHRLAPGVVRRVAAYGRPYARLIAGFLVLIVIGAVLGVLPPLLLKEIVDRGVLARDTGVVVRLALVVAGVALLDAGITLAQRWCSSRLGEGLIFDLRTQVFDHVLAMPLAFFTRTQTGRLTSRLNTDVIGAQQAFTSTLSTSVNNLISLALVLAAMLALSWQLTLAALVLLPVFVLPAQIMGRRLAALTREQMQLNADLSSAMTERFSVAGALLVKLFGSPRAEDDAFAARAGAIRDVSVRIAMNGRIFMTSLTLVAALATALVYGVGGWMSIRGTLTVGTLTALAGLLARLYAPLTQLTNLRVDVMSALVSFERVFEVLDLRPSIRDRPGARDASGVASVELRAVGFAYPDDEASLESLESSGAGGPGAGDAAAERPAGDPAGRPAEPVLVDVSWRAEPGQTVALVGPSGSGKTTMTYLIARLYDVTSGAVLVGGDDVRDLRLTSLRDQLGFVTQDSHMFHDTVRANLAYAAPAASEQAMWDALAAAHVADLVRRLPDGLDTVVGDRGYRLSGGERQRLAIARVLLKAPPIVVLDEATAHLDSASELAVQRALDTAMRGRTSIVIAHRLSTVRGADQILVVDRGRIVERGTHDELLALGGAYAELHRTQLAGD